MVQLRLRTSLALSNVWREGESMGKTVMDVKVVQEIGRR